MTHGATNIDAYPAMNKRAIYANGTNQKVVLIGCFFNPSYNVPQFIAVAEDGKVVSDFVGRFTITDTIEVHG